MKFQTTPYHSDLMKDKERLAVFFEAIEEFYQKNNTRNIVTYDLGCGCGILSYFLNYFFNNVIAIEIDQKAFKCAQNNLSNFKNISLINGDATKYSFEKKADLIICEMLDTALIDEEEVPVLNHAKKFLKKNGAIIPQGVINEACLVNMEREYIHYDDVDSNTKYEILTNPLIYTKINFLDEINPNFQSDLEFRIRKNCKINGILITTYTLLSENIICGPTPMLNPQLLIPLDEKEVKCNDLINVNLKYIMGKGIETIEANYI